MTNNTQRDLKRIKQRIARGNTNVFGRLASIYAASRMQAQRLLQECGDLSVVEWRTLWDLHEAGPMTIGDLAASQRSDQSQLSRALPVMRKKGFVSMCRAPEDGRQTIVTLTDAGHDAYSRAAPVMARRRAALQSELSKDEFETLLRLLEQLESFVQLPIDEIAAKELAK